jgi:N-acetyl sugar amidotransferase
MKFRICSRCVYDSSVSNISFDDKGVCNYCRQIEKLAEEYGTGKAKGEKDLHEIISQIQNHGKNKKYDCVIGVSGGTDSSYLLLKAKEWGLKPLAVHYDNTWNTAIATINISKVTSALNIDLMTYVVDNREVDDIKKSFLLAGVAEFDADTDIAFVQVIRSVAARYGIKYILEGHSFIAEGLTPVGANYLDGAYVASIHDRFGTLRRSTFPNLTFNQFMKWALLYRQKFIRPLWYIEYSKEQARAELTAKTGWQYYAGHHLENRASSFAHTFWLPYRFGIDYRNLTLSADVRRGHLLREDAIASYRQPVVYDKTLIAYVKKRLDISDDQWRRILDGPKRNWRDFRTYKKRFERLRPMFYVLAKSNIVPMSFYLKYCFPINQDK